MSKLNVSSLSNISGSKTVSVDQLADNLTQAQIHDQNIYELLKRSYADAGFTLIDGSFEEGGTLTSSSDVLLHKASGTAYSWDGTLPITVAPNSTPTPLGSGGWVDQSDYSKTEMPYETGTFTPIVAGSSTEGTGNYTVAIGRYTRIGNRCFF